MIVKLWRPDPVDWANLHEVQRRLESDLCSGYRLLAVVPADKWSEVPTFVVVLG